MEFEIEDTNYSPSAYFEEGLEEQETIPIQYSSEREEEEEEEEVEQQEYPEYEEPELQTGFQQFKQTTKEIENISSPISIFTAQVKRILSGMGLSVPDANYVLANIRPDYIHLDAQGFILATILFKYAGKVSELERKFKALGSDSYVRAYRYYRYFLLRK